MANIHVPSMQELLEAGSHFGHKVSRGHPKMSRFIYGARDGVHIIDLASSEAKLKEAANFAYELGKSGKVLMVIGTKKQAKQVVEELSVEANTPFLTSHWVGGLLTNFDELKKNFKKLQDLEKEKVAGTLTRYTKKEQLLITRKLEKFKKELGGVADLESIPTALFVLDTVADKTAVNEANKMNLKIIGVTDTNSNPDLVDYPIPANDDGIKSIKIVAQTILNAYSQGKKDGGTKEDEVAEDGSPKAKVTEEKAPALKKEAKPRPEVDQPVAEKEKKVEAKDEVKEAIEDKIIEAPEETEVAALEVEIEQKVLEEQERKVE